MTAQPEPKPSPRIGDAERDDAVGLLQEHMAAGRLDGTEFDDRMNHALTAKTMGDLTPLFVDLPGRRPDQQVAVPEPEKAPATTESAAAPTANKVVQRVGMTLMSLLWPIAIIVNIATGWEAWWMWIVAVFGSGFIARLTGIWSDDKDDDGHHRDHLERRRERMHDRLDRRHDRMQDRIDRHLDGDDRRELR